MAFVYCKNCNWGQDDFWEFRPTLKYGWTPRMMFGFNPVTMFLEYTLHYARPRWCHMDGYVIEEERARGRKYITKPDKERKGPIYVWSWSMWYNAFLDMIYKFKRQKWWTEKSFKKDKNKICPKCKCSDKWVWD